MKKVINIIFNNYFKNTVNLFKKEDSINFLKFFNLGNLIMYLLGNLKNFSFLDMSILFLEVNILFILAIGLINNSLKNLLEEDE